MSNMLEVHVMPFEPEGDDITPDHFGKRVPLKDRVTELERQMQELRELLDASVQTETAAMSACAQILLRLGPRQRGRVKTYLDSMFGGYDWGKS